MWQTYAKVVQKWPKSGEFWIFFTNFSNTVLTVRTKFSAVILRHFRVLCVRWHQNRISVIWPTAKSSSKWPRNGQLWTLLVFFWKRQCDRSFLQFFYILLGPSVCNGIKTVWLWSDKQPKVALNDQEMANCELFHFCSLKTSLRSNEVFDSHSTPL